MFRLALACVTTVVALAGPFDGNQDGCRYLIICRDELVNSVMPLAEWKHATGVSTKVVPLSIVGNDTTSIKNYVKYAYQNWPMPPEYVLLVGAPTLLASRFYQGQWSYSSDNIYGDVTGDLRLEIPVGRFPAKSSAQLDVMVAKTLAYLQKPELSDTLWMRRLTCAIRDAGDSDWPTYWYDARFAAQLAGTGGFVSCDTFASSLGHSAYDVQNAVSRGTGLVLYRGSATGNWYDPFRVDPASCLGGKKLPIVLSMTCATMTLTPGESMVGEAWVKAGTTENLRGSVAFFGNCHSGVHVAQVRSACARGFFTGLFTENKYKLGQAAIRAKAQLYQEYPSSTDDYRGFNLLGDPELSIWTAKPKELTVQHPVEIYTGQQQIEVEVRHKLTPVRNALVCASMDTSVYSTGMTDSLGRVTLAVNPSDTGQLRLVVTGQNLLPYDANITVIEEVGLEDGPGVPADAVFSARPTAFTGRVVFSVSTRASGRSIVISDAQGRRVCSLELGSSAVVWNGTSQSGSPFGPGVYFCRLLGPSGRTLSQLKLCRLNH